jgi:hypothetical protein
MTSVAFDPISESYSYLWGWPSRAETSESIAARLQLMATSLAEIAPAYGELWPFFAMRALRPKDPGPLLALAVADLATLIDRRARFNPPQRPSPVGRDGYWISLGNNRRPQDPLYASLKVQAGVYRDDTANAVELQVNPNGPAWQSDELVRRAFEGGLQLWSAEWGAVWHGRAEEGDDGVRHWPRLAWTADRFKSHSAPPYIWEYPFPFPFDRPPDATSAHPSLGGELEEWREASEPPRRL